MNRITLMILLLLALSVGTAAAIDKDEELFLTDQSVSYGEQLFLSRVSASAGDRPALGLVLSGGSARAFAHIGVLEYLESKGVVPDFIVSNSMGSIVGLLYGAGLSPDQIFYLIREYGGNDLFKLVFPLTGGLLDTSGFISLISLVTGDLQVEELHIPVMVITEDVQAKRQVQIAEGDFLTVLQASYALPFYFAPVEFKDRLLIDGGIANLVPLAAAKAYADTVIVSTTFYQNPNLNFRNPLTVLNASIDISKTRQGITEMKQHEHILIRSDVEHFSFMDFDQMLEIREAGFRSAEEQFVLDTLSPEMYASGLSHEAVSLRQYYQQRINELPGKLSREGLVPRRDPSLQIRPFIMMYNHSGSRRYLRDELLASLALTLEYKGIRAGVFGGGIWDISEAEFSAAVGADASLFIGPHLSMKGGMLYWSGDSIYAYGNMEGFLGIHPMLNLFVGGSIESQWDLGDGQATSVITGWSGMEADFSDSLNLWGETGIQIGIGKGTHFFSDITLQWFPFPDLSTSQRFLYKKGFDGSSVPLYGRDYLHTEGSSPGSQAAVYTSRAAYYFTQLRPTFGEIIIMKNIFAGIFGEVGSYDITAWAAGISLGADISLIGLEQVSVLLDVGYDASRNALGLFVSINP